MAVNWWLMKGIRVGPARWSGIFFDGPNRYPPASTIPREMSSFHFLFTPIKYDLAKFYWDEVPLIGRPAPAEELEERDTWLELLQDEQCIPPDTLLPRFIDFLAEDWCSFCGFENKPSRLDGHIRNSELVSVGPEVALRFINVDSAFWLMFARDCSLIERVEAHISRLDGFWCESEEEMSEHD